MAKQRPHYRFVNLYVADECDVIELGARVAMDFVLEASLSDVLAAIAYGGKAATVWS